MFRATRDITVGNQLFEAGDEIKNPTTRMFELGLVEDVPELVVKPDADEKVEKPKKVEKKKADKVDEVQPPQDTSEGKEEILTEQSGNVEVTKTEE